MENYTTEIISAIIGLLTLIAGGALISIKKSKKRNQKSHQENIKIEGDGNKVIGGDDNSNN